MYDIKISVEIICKNKDKKFFCCTQLRIKSEWFHKFNKNFYMNFLSFHLNYVRYFNSSTKLNVPFCK